MKVFSGAQLKKGVGYSSIQNYVWVVTVFQLENTENQPTVRWYDVTLQCCLSIRQY